MKTAILKENDETMFMVKSRSLVKALNRAVLAVEVLGEDNTTMEYLRSDSGKHVIVLRVTTEDAPA